MLSVDVDQIDGEFHEERVHRFAGNDPKPGALVEAAVLEEAGSALRTRQRRIDVVADHGAARHVLDVISQALFFIARRCPTIRGG